MKKQHDLEVRLLGNLFVFLLRFSELISDHLAILLEKLPFHRNFLPLKYSCLQIKHILPLAKIDEVGKKHVLF